MIRILETRRFWFTVGAIVMAWQLWKLGLWVQSQIPSF
jgi:hypothetical protein